MSLLWWLNLWKYDRGQFISSFGSWWKSSQFSRSWAPPLKFHTIAWTTIFVQKLRSIFPFWMSKHLIHIKKSLTTNYKRSEKVKLIFQADVSSKKRKNKFYFTTVKPQVDLFLFMFWRKLKNPKRHFEITWPLNERQNKWDVF